MGVREEQKQATRRRVLEAARDLFDEVGFEDTTIRAIAEKAGVSVGSVFTTFLSKADILSQVMLERLAELYRELEHVVPNLRGSTADKLRTFFAIHYAFETRRVKLFLAHIAASFAWRPDQPIVPFGQNLRLREMLRECLNKGIEAGDIRDDADLEVLIDTLMAAYAWNYRLAARGVAGSEGMTEVMDGQIGLIFQGLKPEIST